MFFCAPLLLQSCVHIDVIEGSEWERDGLLSPARDDDRPEEVLDCSRDPLVCDANDAVTIREEYRRRQVFVCI